MDLPGAYSLSAHSLEEVIARDFILDEHPDVTIVVLDATNLERNLYLAVQVMELGAPVALALNMMDRAEAAGTVIDVDLLHRLLGVPAVPTVGTRRRGLENLLSLAIREAECQPKVVDYGQDMELEIARLQPELSRLLPTSAPRYTTSNCSRATPWSTRHWGNPRRPMRCGERSRRPQPACTRSTATTSNCSSPTDVTASCTAWRTRSSSAAAGRSAA